MVNFRPLIWLSFLIVLSLAFVGPAQAQSTADKATARQLFFDASDAMDRNDTIAAADLYRRSNELYPAPTAALGYARALSKLGKLVDAHEQYNAILRRPPAPGASPAFTQAVEDARSEFGALEGRIPALVITVPEGLDAAVVLDGKLVPPAALGIKRLVDAGPRVVSASSPGHEPFETTVTATEGQVIEVVVVMRKAATGGPDEAATGGAQGLLGWVLVGVGGASLVVAAVTGGLFLGRKGVVDDECDDQNRCTQEGLDAVDAGQTLGLVNTVTLFGGVAAAAVGLTLVLTADEGAPVSEVAWSLDPTQAGAGMSVKVRF